MLSRATRLLLDGIIVVSGALALLIAVTGGVDYELGILRLRAHVWWRPLSLLTIAAATRIWLLPLGVEQVAARGFLALLLAAAATYGEHHVRACGGLDSYGYVSASRAIASGTLIEPQPLAALLPFPEGARAAAPLGWVVGRDGTSRVPRFPLGLPIVMAVFQLFGPEGPLFVPLLMALGTVAVVYAACRDSGTQSAALFGAAIVAVNPVFFDLAIQPMSDVPAAFWLTAAAWLALIRQRHPFVAGLWAGMALLTRPVLLPGVLTMVALSISQRKYRVRFAAVVLAFMLVLFAVNQALYGNPWASGYGDSSHLFELSRAGTNAVVYAKWLTYVLTPAFWVAWAAAFLVMRRSTWAWRVSSVAMAAALPYLFYIVYDDWEALRFLLPGIVLGTIVIATGLDSLLGSYLHSSARAVILLLLALACGYASHQYLERHRVFDLERAEAKYPLLGRWLAEHTPPGAVIFAALHSGSIRYYGSRETIRWDEMPSGTVADSVRALRAAGRVTFLAIDTPSEAQPFNARFGAELAELSMMPAGRVREINVWELQIR